MTIESKKILIPYKERSHNCDRCGATQSVKYRVKLEKLRLFNGKTIQYEYNLPLSIELFYCNKCVFHAPERLLLTPKVIQDVLTSASSVNQIYLDERCGRVACVIPYRVLYGHRAEDSHDVHHDHDDEDWFWFLPGHLVNLSLATCFATLSATEISLFIYIRLLEDLLKNNNNTRISVRVLSFLSAYYNVHFLQNDMTNTVDCEEET